MNATSSHFTSQVAGTPTRKNLVQYVPFILFFMLICTPGVTNIASVNFSVAIFPFVIYGYAPAASKAFNSLMPGARNMAVIIVSLTLVICGWGFVTAIGVDSFVRVFRPIYGHASGLAIVFAVFALSRSEGAARRTQLICLVILSMALATTYFIGHRGYGDRYPGFFKHPNQLGPVASMASLFFFCQILTTSARRLAFPLIGLVIAVYAIFLSGSKTNLISFTALCFAAVPLLAFQRSDARQAITEVYRNISIAIGAIALGIIVLPLINARAYNVIDSIFVGDEEVNQYGSVVARAGLWQESWSMALAHPLTGVGAGQLMSDGTEHSHNVFMDAVRTTGFPGLGITIAFICAVLWYFFGAYGAARRLSCDSRSRLSQDDARGAFIGSLMALISYLVSNQMSDSFGPSTIPFFYMFLAFSFTYFLPRSSSGAARVPTMLQAKI